MTTNGLVMNNLKSFCFNPLRGNKEYLYNASGRKILDFQCGINGHILGYNNHIVEKAIINQIHKGFFAQSNQFLNKEKSELYINKSEFYYSANPIKVAAKIKWSLNF